MSAYKSDNNRAFNAILERDEKNWIDKHRWVFEQQMKYKQK